MRGTIMYLQHGVSRSALDAAALLEAQGAYHHEQALALVQQAARSLAQCERQIRRAIEARHAALLAPAVGARVEAP